MLEGSTFIYLHNDHLGSPALTTSGTISSTLKFYAYGKPRSSSGTQPTRYQFTGQYQDDSGLTYMNVRYYDPSIGTFVSADTIVPSSNNPLAYNRYMYVYGKALNFTDPTGHCADGDDWCWKNRWYNARGYFHDRGSWSQKGNPVFADQGILDETMQAAGVVFDAASPWAWDQMVGVGTGVVKLANMLGGVVSGFQRLSALLGPGAQMKLQNGLPAVCAGGAACALDAIPPAPDAITGRYSIYFDNNEVGPGLTFDSQLHWAYNATHELAHVIDWNSNGTFSDNWFVNAPMTNYANCQHCLQEAENWAEAVTVAVFGQSYRDYRGWKDPGVVSRAVDVALQVNLIEGLLR